MSQAKSLIKTHSASKLLKPSSEKVFKVGDTVWVNGTKCGTVAFIGETQFAPGEWVGVHLTLPDGKNDGSVAGVRYFYCEPLHGVFAKASKLTRNPNADAENDMENQSSDVMEVSSLGAFTENLHAITGDRENLSIPCENNKDEDESYKQIEEVDNYTPSSSTNESKLEEKLKNSLQEKQVAKKSFGGGMTSRLPRSNHGSAININQFSSSAAYSDSVLKVGDRVVVGGTKQGTLKFLGKTQFAKGEWAGIELDEPLGKNDGAVEGKRYFKCPQHFGLFAPLTKVCLASTVKDKTNLVRTESHESVNSVSSVQSSSSRGGRVRLGITSFVNQTKTKQSSSSNHMNILALEKALKEKEEHVEQLLAERDFERSEIARSENKMEELEKEMLQMKLSSENTMLEFEQLKQNLRELEEKNLELNSQLEEERRKVDDLQFTMEEASIDKVHWENERKKENTKLEELKKQLAEEVERANLLDQELKVLKYFKEEEKKEEDFAVSSKEKTHPEEILKLIEELSLAKSMLEKFSGQAEKHDAEMKKLEQEREELMHENELLKNREKSNDKSKELNELQFKLQEEMNLRRSCEHEKERLAEDLKAKSQEFVDAMNKRDSEEIDWRKLKDIFQMEKIGLEDEMRELKRKFGTMESDVKRLKDMEKNNETLEHEITSLRIKRTEMEECEKQNISKLQQELASSEEKRSLIAEELELLKLKVFSCNGSHEASWRQLKDELSKQMEEKNLLDKQFNAVKVELEMSQRSFADLQEKFHALEKEIISKNNEIGEKERIYQEVKVAKELTKQQMITLKSESKKIEEQHKVDKEDFKNLKSTLEIKITSLMDELSDQERELLKFKDDFQLQANKIKFLTEELEHKNVLILSLENADSESKKWKEEFYSLNVNHDAYVKHMEEKLLLEAKLKQSLEEKVLGLLECRKNLTADLELLKNDLSSIQNQMVSQVEKIHQLEKTKEDLKRENESLKEKVKNNENITEENFKRVEASKSMLQLKNEMKNNLKEKEEIENDRALLKKEEQSKNEISMASHLSKKDEELIKLKLEESVKRGDLLFKDLSIANSECQKLKELLENQKRNFDEINAKLFQVETFKLVLIKEKDNELEKANDQINFLKKKLEDLHDDLSFDKIDFLNSVIVDIQVKNEKLQQQVDLLMNGGLQSKNQDDTESSNIMKKYEVSSRPYCDICGLFDQHDTVDCPKQSDVEDCHTYCEGDPKLERPYCESCEVFGHFTKDCNDDETY